MNIVIPVKTRKNSSLGGRLKTVPGTFHELRSQRCRYYRSRACPWHENMPLLNGRLPARNSVADFIFIPLELREWEVSKFSISTRLENALGYMECRVLGDLHGLRLSDLSRWRNFGKVTLRELIWLVRSLQEGSWDKWRDPNAAGMEDYYEI